MKSLYIVTPVKDSIESTIETVKAILNSDIKVPYTYTIYNDFSSPENTALLEKYSKELGFNLINISDLTDHPSPNYLLVLKRSREIAIREDAGFLLVESDVVVAKDTLQGLFDGAQEREDCAIAASVTVDDEGKINYPYEYARGTEGTCYAVKKHCSLSQSSCVRWILSSWIPQSIGMMCRFHTRLLISVSRTIFLPICLLFIVHTRVAPGSS